MTRSARQVRDNDQVAARQLRDFERRHKCSDCGAVYLCEICTKAIVESTAIMRAGYRKKQNPVRLYADEHDPRFNVKWFCASCEGSTDDS